MIEIEYDYNDQTLIRATIKPVDDSYDHAFGTERVTDYEVTEINVLAYVMGFDCDVTNSLNKHQIEYCKEWVLEKFRQGTAA